MTDEWVPPECIVCGAVLGHSPDCGDRARTLLRLARRDHEVAIAEWEDWSNTLATILPEDAETWPGVNPDGAQESIIEAALVHLVGVLETSRRIEGHRLGCDGKHSWNISCWPR